MGTGPARGKEHAEMGIELLVGGLVGPRERQKCGQWPQGSQVSASSTQTDILPLW